MSDFDQETEFVQLDAEVDDSKIVLMTGGAGFIGSHVSEYLLKRGDKVIVVDEMNDYYDVRLKKANLDQLRKFEGCSVYRGDICDVDFMSEVFERERPTHVCHLAARAGVRPSIVDPYIYVHSNVEGTTRLLDLARQYSCKNFVYASSSSVYGCSTNAVLSESDIVEKPVSPYAATKKACELFAYTFHHLYGLNCTGLRFFTVYGPRGRPDMAPFKFIDRVYKGDSIQQYGDGSTSRDYTYIDDIVEGVVASIDKPLGCEVINLGNGRPFQLSAFISLVEKSVGKKAVIEVLPCQPGDVDRTCADISKAQSMLGYSPKVPFEEGIRRTAEWYISAAQSGLFKEEELKVLASDSGEFDVELELAEAEAEASVCALNTHSTYSSTSRQPFMSASSSRADRPDHDLKSHTCHKVSSDLELSSYVQKSEGQIKQRETRF
jgi:UDP-glucuronate 4-epimerase